MISLMQADQELLASMSLREFLILEFSYRKNRRKLYSLRALARDLEVPVSSLSIALKGRSRFTEATIHRIAGNLKKTEAVTEYFRHMALAEIGAPGDHSIQAREIRLRYLHALEELPHRMVDSWDLLNLALPLLLQGESLSSDDSLCQRLGLHWQVLETMKRELEGIGWLRRRAGVLSSRIRLLELRVLTAIVKRRLRARQR